jgi:DNA polymerase-3 subunit epsilon
MGVDAMKLLLLDTETSSLDPETGHLLEVGLVRWSVEHRTILSAASWVLVAPENPAETINGIPTAALAEGATPAHVIATTKKWAESCDVIAAHSDFDRKWFPDLGRPWIDTAWDMDWPRAASCSGRRVIDLCLGHGLAVFDAHRALPDCLLLARLLERCAELGHDVEAMIRKAMRPRVAVEARGLPFDRKDEAKNIGFRWDDKARVWWKRVLPEEIAELPFRVVEARRGA